MPEKCICGAKRIGIQEARAIFACGSTCMFVSGKLRAWIKAACLECKR